MTVEISSDQPRSIRAIEIAAGAAQWIKGTTRDGRRVYGVPSRSVPGLYHLTDAQQCSCRDFEHTGQPCQHVLACRLYLELVKAQQPKPVRWQRHDHPNNGNVTYLPQHMADRGGE